MRALLASPLGLLIGLSLGALGGGGSILAVPALVYAAGQSPRQATTTSLVLVGLTSIIGIAPQWRAQRVRVGAGAIFGLAGVGGSLLGSKWNKAADPDVLLLAFSGLMFVAAFGMWRRVRAGRARTGLGSLGAAAATPTPARTPTRQAGLMTVSKVAVAGTVIGLLTGFFGAGGGFVIVPTLVLALGYPMPEAVGTSLLVIAINSAVALTTRLQSGSIEWATVIPFAVACLVGVIAGSQLAGKHDSIMLQRWFVGLLVVVAIYTATRSAIALAQP
jgi:uncharacterized membrane protein YfcA